MREIRFFYPEKEVKKSEGATKEQIEEFLKNNEIKKIPTGIGSKIKKKKRKWVSYN